MKLDTFNKNYFSQEQLQSINTANKILQELTPTLTENNDRLKKEKLMRSFLKNNQEITMKSYIIKIIEQERNIIAHKNLSMKNSVSEIEKKLDQDLKIFEKYIEIEKIKKKERERVMNEHVKENKSYYEKKKELIQQNKLYLDEIDRMVKLINSLKEYRKFVHDIVGSSIDERQTKPIRKKSSLYDVIRNEKDIEKIGEELIRNCSDIIKENKPDKITELLSDHKGLIKVFVNFEGKILKSIEARQQLQESSGTAEGNSYVDIRELEDKLVKLTAEMDLLKREKNIAEEQVKRLKTSSTAMTNDKESIEVIKELHKMTSGTYLDPKKSVGDMLKELADYLKKREFETINYIDVIERISLEDQENKLKKIIDLRKEINKNEKVQIARQKLENEINLSKRNAEERMNRIVIKGRKAVGKVNLEVKNVKGNSYQTKKEDDDEDLYIY